MECSGGQQYVKWRIFEAMAMGCLVISDRFKLLDYLFVPGKHYLPCNWKMQEDGRRYLDPDNLIEQIKKVKKNPNLRKHIIDTAFNEVKKEHTYKHRAEMILDKLKLKGEKL